MRQDDLTSINVLRTLIEVYSNQNCIVHDFETTVAFASLRTARISKFLYLIVRLLERTVFCIHTKAAKDQFL